MSENEKNEEVSQKKDNSNEKGKIQDVEEKGDETEGKAKQQEKITEVKIIIENLEIQNIDEENAFGIFGIFKEMSYKTPQYL